MNTTKFNTNYRNLTGNKNDFWVYNRPINTFSIMDNVIVKPAKDMNAELMKLVVGYDGGIK